MPPCGAVRLDDGEAVHSWPCSLHPGAEQLLDWHNALRFTVLRQLAKSDIDTESGEHDPPDRPEKLLTSAKWYLWHGNTHSALERLDELADLVDNDDRMPESAERRERARTLN